MELKDIIDTYLMKKADEDSAPRISEFINDFISEPDLLYFGYIYLDEHIEEIRAALSATRESN